MNGFLFRCRTLNDISIDSSSSAVRFINHQGRDKIVPAVRFGAISVMLEPIWHTRYQRDQLSYAVEMRSRTGFSGSPVAAYRTIATNLSRTESKFKDFYGLLGVNWGYVYDENGENTWLNGVIPAWKILELLKVPALQRQYEGAVSYAKKRISEELAQHGAKLTTAT